MIGILLLFIISPSPTEVLHGLFFVYFNIVIICKLNGEVLIIIYRLYYNKQTEIEAFLPPDQNSKHPEPLPSTQGM